MKKTAFKSALIFTNSYEHFFRLDIPNPAKVLKKVIAKDGSYYILTGDGDLWKIKAPSQSNKDLSDSLVVSNITASSLEDFNRIVITEITANDMVMLAVSDKGHVYSWGRDTRKYGLLGLGHVHSAETPTRLLNLSKIQQVSLSSKHAAALDSNGEIYTWGTGNYGELCHANTNSLDRPTLFRSHELLSCKNVVCYKNLTAVVTTGGHLFLYGSFAEDNKLSMLDIEEKTDIIENNIPGKDGPRTILNMPNAFVTEIYFGSNFCVFLTKSLEIYIISDFYMCQKLDYAYKFQTIAVKQNRIYGISDDGKFLVEWEYRRHSALLRQEKTRSFMSESCTEVVQVIHLFDEYQKGTHFQPFQETGEVTLLLDSDTNIRPYLKDKHSYTYQNLATVKFQRISGIGSKGKTKIPDTGISKILDNNSGYSTRKVRSPSNNSFISQELSFERIGSGMSSLVFSQDKSRVPSLTDTKSPQHNRVSSFSKDKNSDKLVLSQVDETRSSNDSFRTALEKKITLKIENSASAKKGSGRSVLDGFEGKSGAETLKEKKSFYLLNSPTSLMSSGTKQRGTVNPNETLAGTSKISLKNNEITSWVQEGKGLDRSRDSSLIRPDSFLSPKNSVKVFASTTKSSDKTVTNTKKSFVFESILPEQVRARSREPSNDPPTLASPVKEGYKISTPKRVHQPQQSAEKGRVQTKHFGELNDKKSSVRSNISMKEDNKRTNVSASNESQILSSLNNSTSVTYSKQVNEKKQQGIEKSLGHSKDREGQNEKIYKANVSNVEENRRAYVSNEQKNLSAGNNSTSMTDSREGNGKEQRNSEKSRVHTKDLEELNEKNSVSKPNISTKGDNKRIAGTTDSTALSPTNKSINLTYSKQGSEKDQQNIDNDHVQTKYLEEQSDKVYYQTNTFIKGDNKKSNAINESKGLSTMTMSTSVTSSKQENENEQRNSEENLAHTKHFEELNDNKSVLKANISSKEDNRRITGATGSNAFSPINRPTSLTYSKQGSKEEQKDIDNDRVQTKYLEEQSDKVDYQSSVSTKEDNKRSNARNELKGLSTMNDSASITYSKQGSEKEQKNNEKNSAHTKDIEELNEKISVLKASTSIKEDNRGINGATESNVLSPTNNYINVTYSKQGSEKERKGIDTKNPEEQNDKVFYQPNTYIKEDIKKASATNELKGLSTANNSASVTYSKQGSQKKQQAIEEDNAYADEQSNKETISKVNISMKQENRGTYAANELDVLSTTNNSANMVYSKQGSQKEQQGIEDDRAFTKYNISIKEDNRRSNAANEPKGLSIANNSASVTYSKQGNEKDQQGSDNNSVYTKHIDNYQANLSMKEGNKRANAINESDILLTTNNSTNMAYSKPGNEKEIRSYSQLNSPHNRGVTADTSYTDLHTITSLKPGDSMRSTIEDQEKPGQGKYFLTNGSNYSSNVVKSAFGNNKPDYLNSQSMRTPKKQDYLDSFLGDKTSQDTIYLDSECDQKQQQSQIVYRETLRTNVYSPKSSAFNASSANQKGRPESFIGSPLNKAVSINRSYLNQDQTNISESRFGSFKKQNGGLSHQSSPKRQNSEKKYETLLSQKQNGGFSHQPSPKRDHSEKKYETLFTQKQNGGLSHQTSPKRGNSEMNYETLVAQKESTKKALYELLGKQMPDETKTENFSQPNQPRETEKRSAFLIEGDYQEGTLSHDNTDDARSYMRYLGNGSIDLEKHEDEMSSQISKPRDRSQDKDNEKAKSWISSIGPEETREGSLKDFTKTTEGTLNKIFSLVDDTMPRTPQNVSSVQTPQNKPAAPQLELEKWGAFLSFMGNEANQSPGTRVNSNKSTGKFMIREYIAKDETSSSSPIRKSIADNFELLKSDGYKKWEREQKTLNLANMLLRKIDRTMYRCFVTLQLYGVKPSNEKTLAVLRLVNALKGAERSYKLKNKEVGFEMIKKIKYQSLMKVVPKYAFRKLAGLMRMYTALDKEITSAKQEAFSRLKNIYENHKEQAEKQETLISKSVDILSSKRQNQLVETLKALKECAKAKKEKESKTKSLNLLFDSLGQRMRRNKLESVFQQMKRETKLSHNLSGLFNVMNRYLLAEGLDTLTSYSQVKKEKYLNLVADEKNFVNLSMEKLLLFIKRRAFCDIYNYSRNQVRKMPKSTLISFSVIMKSLYMKRLKGYYDTLRWHAVEQGNTQKNQLKDILLKHLVGILQKKVTEKYKEGLDAMKVHQEIMNRMKVKEAKELEFKAMLLASKLNVMLKQRKTAGFYALKQSQNLQNHMKNKRYVLLSLKSMIENMKRKTLKDAFNEILEVVKNARKKKKELEEQESKDKHSRKFNKQLDISEIDMTKHDSQMSPSELEHFLLRNSSGALVHRKSRFHFKDDDSFGIDLKSPFSPEKNEDIKLDFEGMLAAVKSQRKLYRSWSDILTDKHYLKFNEPGLAKVEPRKSRSLVLVDQEQEHNETYRTASFLDKQKCKDILECLRRSLPTSLAKIKNETFRKQSFSSSTDSQDNDQSFQKAEPENTKTNGLDMIAIRDILGKRALRNSQTIKLTRKRTEYVDQRIFLHKGPHHNRPDEVREMFHQKVPNHYSNDNSVASADQSSNKLNLSGFLQLKPSKSMVVHSSDNIDKYERKNSAFHREAKSKNEIKTKEVGSHSEFAGSVSEIEEFNPGSYEGKILTESLDMSSMRITPTDNKRRTSLYKFTVDKEALKALEKNDRSFIELDRPDLNQIEEGSSLSDEGEQEDLTQLKSTTSIDAFMHNPQPVVPTKVLTKAKSKSKALTINVIQPSGAKKQEAPKSTKSIASQKSVKVEKSTPSKVKKEEATKDKTLKKSATLNKPSGNAGQSAAVGKGAGKSLFQTKSPLKK